MEIYSLIGQTEQIDIKINYDWDNLYIVDLAMFPHKVGALINYETVQDINGIENPRLKLKKRLLEENGWALASVNYSEFVKDPKKVTQDLVETLKKLHQKSVKEQGTKDAILNKVQQERINKFINFTIPEAVKQHIIEKVQKTPSI